MHTDTRDEVLAVSAGLCVHCGALAQEIDHIIPKAAKGGDDISNLSAVCKACHKEKSCVDLNRVGVEDLNMFTSRFSDETWEGFVKSRKPTQIVCDLHKPIPSLQVVNVDVKSCRLSALIEANAHDIPIFSPIDEFKPSVAGVLCDYNWVDLGACKSILGVLPYDGPRWYDKASCEFFLEVGIATWRDFKLSYQASAHRSAKDLATRLNKMKQMWEQVGESKEGVD